MTTIIKANYLQAKGKAEKILKDFEIFEPIIPVEEIAQREGLKISYFKPKDSESKSAQVSGFFDPETKTIYVNIDDSPSRRMFTIAHELGHYELDHKPDEYDVLYRFAEALIDKNPKEQEANCFAANLLVPEKMLSDVIKKYDLDESSAPILANLFGVSKEVIKYRMRWLKERH